MVLNLVDIYFIGLTPQLQARATVQIRCIPYKNKWYLIVKQRKLKIKSFSDLLVLDLPVIRVAVSETFGKGITRNL